MNQPKYKLGDKVTAIDLTLSGDGVEFYGATGEITGVKRVFTSGISNHRYKYVYSINYEGDTSYSEHEIHTDTASVLDAVMEGHQC